jgi:hypothetical protein
MEMGLLEYQFWIIKSIKVIYFLVGGVIMGDFVEHFLGPFFE